jgi:hypothetical protein
LGYRRFHLDRAALKAADQDVERNFSRARRGGAGSPRRDARTWAEADLFAYDLVLSIAEVPMRFPVLVFGAIALSGCSGNPTSSTPTARPSPAGAAFRVTTEGATAIDNLRTAGSGPTALTCGDIRIRFVLQELSGVGARVLRQETLVVEHDGGLQPGRTTDVDVTIPAAGRGVVETEWTFCGQRAVDFPMQLKSALTIRDEHGNEQRLAAGAVLAAFEP